MIEKIRRELKNRIIALEAGGEPEAALALLGMLCFIDRERIELRRGFVRIGDVLRSMPEYAQFMDDSPSWRG